MSYDLLKTAVRTIAGRCDGAVTKDGVGFNSADTSLGRFLAAADDSYWSPAVAKAAWTILHTYTGQLLDCGIDLDAIDQTEFASGDASDGRAAASQWYKDMAKAKKLSERHFATRFLRPGKDGKLFWLKFPYDPSLMESMKSSLSSRRWHRDLLLWSVLPTEWTNLKKWAVENEFTFDEAACDALADQFKTDHATADQQQQSLPATYNVTTNPGAFKFSVKTPYNPEIVEALKAIPTAWRSWDKDRKLWLVSDKGSVVLSAIIGRFGLLVDPSAKSIIDAVAGKMSDTIRMSSSTESKGKAKYTVEDGLALYPYQEAGVDYIMTQRKVIVGDAMGVGKTVQAIVSTNADGRFPALVICPSCIKLQWANEIKRWTGKDAVVVGGTKPTPDALESADYVVINYDVVAAWVSEICERGFGALVVDESHYAKNAKAGRTAAIIKISKTISGLVVLLTGTPVENRPIELASQLEIVGHLDTTFGGLRSFKNHYCWDNETGTYNGARNMPQLNHVMRSSFYIRRTKDQVLTEMPQKTRAFLQFAGSKQVMARYAKAEKDLSSWFDEVAAKHAAEHGVSKEEASAVVSKASGTQAEALARINALRQLSAEAKLVEATEWLMQQDEQVVVFAHHRAVVEALATATSSPMIVGGMSPAERDEAIAKFKSGSSRFIICSIQAAGTGVDGLQVASNVLFVEQAWNPSKLEQAEDRLHRIGQRDAVTAWYARLDIGIDEYIFDMIESKRRVVNDVLNGTNEAETASVSVIEFLKYASRS